MALPRLLIGLPLAAIVTLALFFLMRALITQDFELPEQVEGVTIDIIRQENPDEGRPDEDALTRPDTADAPPPPPLDIDRGAPSDLGGVPLAVPGAGDIEFAAPNIGAGGAQPIFFPTQYPDRLAGRIDYNVQVILEFDITTGGTAQNIRVIAVNPPSAPDDFARAAVRTIERSRWRPAVGDDGQPEAEFGRQQAILYEPPA